MTSVKSRPIFNQIETQNINTPHKKIYSLKAIITGTTSIEMWKKMYLVPVLPWHFWNALAEYFGGIRSKGGNFVKYLLWHQNYFGKDCTPPPPPHF